MMNAAMNDGSAMWGMGSGELRSEFVTRKPTQTNVGATLWAIERTFSE
jgi:hypothetical protein